MDSPVVVLSGGARQPVKETFPLLEVVAMVTAIVVLYSVMYFQEAITSRNADRLREIRWVSMMEGER